MWWKLQPDRDGVVAGNVSVYLSNADAIARAFRNAHGELPLCGAPSPLPGPLPTGSVLLAWVGWISATVILALACGTAFLCRRRAMRKWRRARDGLSIEQALRQVGDLSSDVPHQPATVYDRQPAATGAMAG